MPLSLAEEPDKIKQLRDACTMAKRNYEALNQQLIEELPHFIQLAQNMINHTLTVLFQLQYKFYTAVRTILELLMGSTMRNDEHRLRLSSDELHEVHGKALAEIAVKLITLSIVPTSLAMNYTLPGTIRVGSRQASENSESSEREGGGEGVSMSDSILSTSSEMDMDGSIAEVVAYFPCTIHLSFKHCYSPQEHPDPQPPALGSELQVVYDFEAQDKAELSVSAGHTVILRCPHDRIGCTEWWLVESQQGTGYVPASFLEYNGNTYT